MRTLPIGRIPDAQGGKGSRIQAPLEAVTSDFSLSSKMSAPLLTQLCKLLAPLADNGCVSIPWYSKTRSSSATSGPVSRSLRPHLLVHSWCEL